MTWRSFSVSASLWDIVWDLFLSEVNSRWLTEAAVDSRVEEVGEWMCSEEWGVCE